MRYPHGAKGARKALEADTDGEPIRKPNRRAVPPDDWDDLLVSYWRGQEWARR